MLLLKHIFRSIKKSPIQPLIIILTLSLSVATFITAIKLSINIAKENEYYANQFDYAGDITIKPSKNDDIRFLFAEDAKDIIEDAGTVYGEFNLTALFRKDDHSELIDIYAADLPAADNFYQFKFRDYGDFTEENVNKSIILSSAIADKFDITIGDIFEINLLNKRMKFTVQAIGADDGVLENVEGVININAILDEIASSNPAISSFAANIIPYTVLKININDPTRIDEFINKLNADERFSGKIITKYDDDTAVADFIQKLSLLIVFISTSLITAISVIVIFTSLDLLNKKRIKDSALFMISGADNSQLNKILYLECFIYSLISAILGIILSLIINTKINDIFKWNVDNISFKLYDISLALFAAPVTMLLAAYIHTLKAKKLSISERLMENSENKSAVFGYRSTLVIFLIFLAFALPTFFTTPKFRYIFAIPALIFFLTFIFSFVPRFVHLLSVLFIKILEKREYVPPKSILTFKNLIASYPLKHAARLITILLTIISAITICVNSVTTEMTNISKIIDCRYVSIGANERTDDILEDLDMVDDTFRLNFVNQMLTLENTGVLGVSISDDAIEYINSDLAPQKAPKNNEVIITSGIAKLENKNIGDSISFVYQAKTYTFIITEVIKSTSNIIFLDSSYIGENNQLLCIKSGIDKNSEEYQKIANILETRGAALMELDVALDPINKRVLYYSELLMYVVGIAFFTTALGIINVLVSSYIARKREREVYFTVGMSKSQIRTTQLIEMLHLAFISLVLLPLFTFLALSIIENGIISFGVDLFYF